MKGADAQLILIRPPWVAQMLPSQMLVYTPIACLFGNDIPFASLFLNVRMGVSSTKNLHQPYLKSFCNPDTCGNLDTRITSYIKDSNMAQGALVYLPHGERCGNLSGPNLVNGPASHVVNCSNSPVTYQCNHLKHDECFDELYLLCFIW